MCVSRLHLVVGGAAGPDGDTVTVRDVDGAEHVVSLLAFEGDPPAPGEWLVVHSGYALERVDPDEASAVAAEIAAASGAPAVGGEPGHRPQS
jgi:hydrogenase expression/formation protein HypC